MTCSVDEFLDIVGSSIQYWSSDGDEKAYYFLRVTVSILSSLGRNIFMIPTDRYID